MDDLYDDRKRVTTNKLIGFTIGFGLFLLLVFKSEPGFVFLLDHANLLFHEAGHPAVGLFSKPADGVWWNTRATDLSLVVLAVAFWRKRELVSCAASVVWFFENWLNIARYMADARAQELPLVGGGEHDWANIRDVGACSRHDTQIAAVVRAIGWLGMAAAYLWVVWRRWRANARLRNPRQVE